MQLRAGQRHGRRLVYVRFNAWLLLAAVAVTGVAERPTDPSDAKFATSQAQRIVVRNESGDELVISEYDGLATGIAMDVNRKRPGRKAVVLADVRQATPYVSQPFGCCRLHRGACATSRG